MFTRSSKPAEPMTAQPAATITPPSMPAYAVPSVPLSLPPTVTAPAPSINLAPGNYAVPASSMSAITSFSAPKKAAPSIVTADLKIKGDLESEGDIQLEGEVYGTVSAPSLTIAESGAVHGEIFVDSLRVYGRINGTTRARVVDLAKASHVVGDIYHQQLTIETGAYIDGHCKRVDTGDFKASASTRDPKDGKEPKEPRADIKIVEGRADVRAEPPSQPLSRPETATRPTLRGRARPEAATASEAKTDSGAGADRIAAMLGRLEGSTS